MCYLKFDKAEMTNLQESLYKELLITNRSGAYCSTTLTGCNIRKYDGLLVVPIPELDGENHVLLSSLDETVIQHGAEFNLGLHKYQGGSFSPKGHKYILSFEWDKVPTWTYRVGGVLLRKEMIFDTSVYRIYIRYTLLEAHSPTTLRLSPFLAFRSVRQWMHENPQADRGWQEIPQGISMCLYNGYPTLYMQTSEPATWNYVPNWYRNLEYPKESERGYYATEDLLVPGYFELPIKKNESVIFSAGTAPIEPSEISQMLEKEKSTLDRRDSFYHCLVNAAHQFGVHNDGESYLLAGYPWFKCRARDTFIAMPGLTLAIEENEKFEQYMQTAAKGIRNFIRQEPMSVDVCEMEQPDVLFWAIWCLQQYAKYTSRAQCYQKYGDLLKEIMLFIWSGKHPNLFVHENGLVYADGKQTAITWMNSQQNGHPIIPRSGYIVEFNALWYNALRFFSQILSENDPSEHVELVNQANADAEKVGESFKHVFLNEHGYLLDYVDGQMMDWSVRPNQLLAIALDFSPLSMQERKGVLDICTKELVTPKGIRSLSPKSGGYNPMYVGVQAQRDQAYHQGTAWPWLMGFYLEAYQRVYKMSGMNYIERQLIGFEEELFYHCVGTIPELFDGNPPYHGRGAISFAINVAGILRALRQIEKVNATLDDGSDTNYYEF